MTRTQLKDARRNIKKQLISFISIVVIAMIAVMAYLGIAYPAAAIKTYFENYYDRYRLWDLEVNSTMLMDDEDLEAIRALPGVKKAEALYQIDAGLPLGDTMESVLILSTPQEISLPELLEGRLPETPDECAIEQELVKRWGFSVGQRVNVETTPLAGIDPLLQKDFVITGVFKHPEHVSFMVSVKPYLMVLADSFNREGLEGAFMKTRILVEDAPKERFGEAYFNVVKPVENAIVSLADRQTQHRVDKFRAAIDEQLKEGRQKVDDGKQQLEDGRRQLEDGRRELEEKRAELEDGRRQVEDGRRELEEKRAELEDGRRQVEDGRRELEEKRAELEDGRRKIEDGRRELEEKRGELEDGRRKIEDGRRELEEKRKELEDGRRKIEDGRRELEEKRKELEDGREKLTEARQTLDDGWKSIADAEAQLKDAAAQLDEGGKALAEAEIQLAPIRGLADRALSLIALFEDTGHRLPGAVGGVVQSYRDALQKYSDGRMTWYFQGEEYLDAVALVEQNRKLLTEGEAEYASSLAQFEDGERQLAEGERQLRDAEQQLADGERQFADGERQLRDAEQQLKDGERQFADGEAELRDAEQQLADAERQFAEGEQQLRDAEQQLKDGERQLAEGEAELRDAEQRIADAEQQFADGEQQLKEGEAELQDAERQIKDGEAALQDGETALDALGECKWVVLNDRGNAGYMYADTSAGNLSKLSLSFSLIFIAVGALVIYATIGRMVEEQRKLIGATKAMGLFNREIFGKYLSFGVGGTMLGVVLGILLSYFGMQPMIISANKMFFVYDKIPQVSMPLQTGIVFAGALAVSGLSVRVACTELLKSPAISLMQGKAPKSAKKTGRSAKKSLYTRLILLNMRTDLSRVLVTTVSIMGCCMMLVAGFTMKYAVSRVNARQFGQIVEFEGELYFDGTRNENAEAELRAVLDREGLRYLPVRKADAIFQIGDTLSSGTAIVAEQGRLDGFYSLRDTESGEALGPTDGGVLVPGRLLEYYSLHVGDELMLYNTRMNRMEAPVTGSFNNYFGQLLFFTPAGYEAVFGEEAMHNCFLIRLGELSLDELQKKLTGIEGFESLQDAHAERERFDNLSAVLNLVIAMLLVLAAVMSYFILMNLSMTYIQRKTKELTIMRINGFTVAECVRYAAWDLVLTTAAGIVLGLAVGHPIAVAIVKLVEQSHLQFVREADVRTFIYCALIMLGFSVAINGFALSKIRNLKLSDAI